MPTVVFDDVNFDRDSLLDLFKENNIDGRSFFWPLSSLPMFSRVDNPNSYSIHKRGINLPSYYDMLDSDQEIVVSLVKKHMDGAH